MLDRTATSGFIESFDTIERSENLDRVIAYVVGDGTADEHLTIANALATGDAEICYLHTYVTELFSQIPDVLPLVESPSLIREQVLANAKSVSIAGNNVIALRKKTARRIALALILLLLLIATPLFGPGLIEWVGSGQLQAGGSSTTLQNSDPVHSNTTTSTTTVAESLDAERSTAETSTEKSLDEKMVVETRPQAGTSTNALENTARPVDTAPAEPAVRYAKISDVKQPELQYDLSYPSPIPSMTLATNAKTNFVAFETNARLQEDLETRLFALAPVAGSKGTASVIWSTVSGAVLLRLKGLEASPKGSNYVLYYIDDNDKAQRMLAFAISSGAELMLIPPKIPSRSIKRVILTLEKMVETLEGPVLHRQEVLFSDYKEKVILMKPLK